MPIYQASFTTAAAAAAAAVVDLRSAAGARVKLLELGIFNTAATAATLELARSTTLGTTSTTVVPQPIEPAEPAATAVIGTAWSVAPASTAVGLRSIVLGANIGAGIIWTFDELVIPVSSSFVLMNRGGAAIGISRGYIVYRE